MLKRVALSLTVSILAISYLVYRDKQRQCQAGQMALGEGAQAGSLKNVYPVVASWIDSTTGEVIQVTKSGIYSRNGTRIKIVVSKRGSVAVIPADGESDFEFKE